MMIEGSGSGSIPLTSGSGSGFGTLISTSYRSTVVFRGKKTAVQYIAPCFSVRDWVNQNKAKKCIF